MIINYEKSKGVPAIDVLGQMAVELETRFKIKDPFDVNGITDNRLVIEYELPYSTGRIDILVFGQDQNNSSSVVLLELKQWSK